MEITDIKIRRMNHVLSSKLRAVVSVIFDEEFVVHDIKVIQNEQKFFIAMPSRRLEDGLHKDTAHPIKTSLRTKIQDAVLEKYYAELAAIKEKQAN